MEWFVYICNENEFVKFLEAFGENLKTLDEIFYYDKVFALKGTTNINLQIEDKLLQTVNETKTKLENKFDLSSEDIIYISVHPGGTSLEEIKKILTNVNTQLNKEKKDNKILLTYHGSQNIKANDIWKEERLDIGKLNNAIIDFIKPDINQIFKKYRSEILIEKRLIDEAFGAKFDCEQIKIIFDIDNCTDDLMSALKEYKNALDTALNYVNEKYMAFYKKAKKISGKDHTVDNN